MRAATRAPRTRATAAPSLYAALRALWVATPALWAFAACTASPPPDQATVISPVYDDGCAHEECSQHGECSAGPNDAPMCLCEVGYGGAHCGSCEADFHLDARGRCLPDRTCAEQDVDPCGVHGACDDTEGVIACQCDDGYEGPRCELCAPGHARNALGECLVVVVVGDGDGALPDDADSSSPDAAADASGGTCKELGCNDHGHCSGSDGRIFCQCDVEYGGTLCEACSPGHFRDSDDRCITVTTCTNGLCGGRGACDDRSGLALCTCDEGYGGSACDACAPGFHAGGDACELDEQCLASTCAGHGGCSASAGVASCDCDTGYSGDHCEHCADGHHRDLTDACVTDAECGADSCSPHGTCDDSTGVISCDCDPGYAGLTCAACAAGFHDDGDDACALDEQCVDNSCPAHATCADDTGVIECTCDEAYVGAQCEGCAPGHYRSYATNACVTLDCSGGTPDTGVQNFEGIDTFPLMNTCQPDDDTPLSTPDLTFASIGGDGLVWMCGPSTFNSLTTNYVLLDAGATQPAQLIFGHPIAQLSFDYAAISSSIALDVLADGVVIGTLSKANNESGTASYSFTAPITLFALRGSGTNRNSIGIDNIVYAPACP